MAIPVVIAIGAGTLYAAEKVGDLWDDWMGQTSIKVPTPKAKQPPTGATVSTMLIAGVALTAALIYLKKKKG